jgi:hypothetical protein
MGLGTKLRNTLIRRFVSGLVKDVRKGEYGQMLKSLWDMLDGRKTWLGLITYFLPQFVDLIARVIEAGGGSPTTFMRIAGLVGVIVGALHKLVKDE